PFSDLCNHPNRALTQLLRVPPWFGHDTILSKCLGLYKNRGASPISARPVLSLVLAHQRTAGTLRRFGLQRVVEMALERDEPRQVDVALASQLLPPSDWLLQTSLTSDDLLEYRYNELAKFLSDVVGQPLERTEPGSGNIGL
ncbi:MAG: hypothetical protein ACRDLB_04350, partial [Actinomycetota bacterium]